MTPADFREFVFAIADKSDLLVSVLFSVATIWDQTAGARKCGCGDGKIRRAGKGIRGAGFSKIHLDASMSCADDPIR